MKRTVTEDEFRDYLAFFGEEPMPADRLDWWAGHMLAAQLNPWRGERSLPVKVRDVTPDWWGDRPEVSENGLSGLVAWLEGMAGRSTDGSAGGR